MGFEITEIEELSGNKARIYSVIIDGEEGTLLEQFFEENKDYRKELSTMLYKIKTMSEKTGCIREFFKEGEGVLADGVMALKVGKLRLYGLYFNKTVVLFGSGGVKNVRAYQEDPYLNAKAEQMKYIASKINAGIRDRSIKIGEDGTIDCKDFEVYD
jgi:hypothetical protein